jgi:hypothetical protein
MPRRIVGLVAIGWALVATTTVFAQTCTMQRASLRFGAAPGGGDDVVQLRSLVPMSLNGFDSANEAFTLTISDADGTIFTVTVPPGSFVVHGPRRLRYFDRTGTIIPGLRKVTVRDSNGGVKVRAVAKNVDLGDADRVDITTTFEFGPDTFGTSNHYRALRSEFRFH